MESMSGKRFQLNSVKSPGWLSTNPAASQNSYFPVGVDDTGFVSLKPGQKLQSWSSISREGEQRRGDHIRDERLDVGVFSEDILRILDCN
jgi:hypothetical protein